MVECDQGEGEESPEDEGVEEAGDGALTDDLGLAEDLGEEGPEAGAEGVEGEVGVGFGAADGVEDGQQAAEKERGGEEQRR